MMSETVTNIVSVIWQSVLGLEVAPAEPQEDDGTAARTITAGIGISGAWEGVVTASIPQELGKKVAAVMLHIAERDVTPQDARDCARELVNMIGGNFKATLEGHCNLSLPWVMAEGGAGPPSSQWTVLEQVALDTEGSRLCVTIFSGKFDREREAS